MLHKGIITTWKNDKGFGFIKPINGGDRVFIHIKAFSEPNLCPVEGDVVVYSMARDDQGRMQAVNAKFSVGKKPSHSGQRPSLRAIMVAALFFVAIIVSVRETRLPQLALVAYAIMSAITFIAYAIDKSAAQAGRWRTSEATLHLLALVGGWPGALLAQQILRHKSKKSSFRAVFWITVLLNCAAFAWMHSAEGRKFLQQLMELVT